MSDRSPVHERAYTGTGERRRDAPDGLRIVVTPAVFLDRDGTLIEERGYLDRLDLLTLFPWTTDALRLLKRAGFATVVITNQAAVARGIIDEAFLAHVHRELDVRLARGDAAIDRYYYCPHVADARLEQYRMACHCRHHQPGGGGARHHRRGVSRRRASHA